MERAAKALVRFGLGTFEDQRRKPNGEYWLVPPYSPNDRAREAAIEMFRAIRFDTGGLPLNWSTEETEAMVRGWNRAQDRGRGIRESLFAVVNEWCRYHLARGIAARSDETPQAARPEGQEPDPEGGAPTPPERSAA